jgi:spore coat polysaccharide biosynthesis predicted glycosyltransferase SpsG
MTEKRDLVFRADANARMGPGHLMRNLALAEPGKDLRGR